MARWMFTDAKNMVACPKCGQPAGEDCRTPKGRKTWPPHKERTVELLKKVPKETYQSKARLLDCHDNG
jgi:hypothetical protein